MITKILFTLFILVAAMTYVRYKRDRAETAHSGKMAATESGSRVPMYTAIALVFFTLSISGAMYYSHWQASHTLYTVQVVNSHSGEVQIYHVYRDDIDGRSFRTIDGRLINLSTSERMEVHEGTGIADTHSKPATPSPAAGH